MPRKLSIVKSASQEPTASKSKKVQGYVKVFLKANVLGQKFNKELEDLNRRWSKMSDEQRLEAYDTLKASGIPMEPTVTTEMDLTVNDPR